MKANILNGAAYFHKKKINEKISLKKKINSIETSRKNPICFDNSFVQLGEKFYAKLNPTPVEQPKIVKLNDELANNLGIDLEMLNLEDWASIFSGNRILQGESS